MTPIDVSVIFAVLIAIGGGAFASFLGWAESEAAFNPRKMFVALVRGGLAGVTLTGVIVAVQGLSEPLTVAEYILMFFSAVGVDLASVKGSKIVKNVNSSQSPTTPPPT